MNKEIFEKLAELEIEYEKIEHPAAFTMEEIDEEIRQYRKSKVR